jgi:uncharacterized membrane protein YphA (DoxX/SURF4 family)
MFGGITMKFTRLDRFSPLTLRVFLGLTVLFWGYEKLTLEKLVGSYKMDYQQFMFIDVNTFLNLGGWLQLIMGVLLIAGVFTRFNALALALMGFVTIIIPGMIVVKDVPHFAYAFALSGGALVLLIQGGGDYSFDKYWRHFRCARLTACEQPG